jgi:hypothetical protein
MVLLKNDASAPLLMFFGGRPVPLSTWGDGVARKYLGRLQPLQGDRRPGSFLGRGKREREREREGGREGAGGQVVKSCPFILNAAR